MRNGVVYEVANSETIENRGPTECEVWAAGMSGTKGMTIQIAPVHKTLLAVSKLTKTGHTVVFSDIYGNFIENNYTRERIYMRKTGTSATGNLYEVDLWVRCPFTRQG